jgi:hypothetical protein
MESLMRQRWNELVSRILAGLKPRTKEVERYLPAQFSEELAVPEVHVTEELALRINEVGYLIANRRYEEAAELAQSAYRAGAMAGPLAYEHTLLIEPFEEMIFDSQRTPAMAEAMALRFEAWFRSAPGSPFAAALFATALHNAGFAWRGTGSTRDVSGQSRHKLAMFEKAALDVFQASGGAHSGHWYWRECYFDFSITDYRGARDHRVRFDKAIELQPLSARLWKNGAYHLLPRWHGHYQMLHEHCVRAHEATKAHAGTRLYHELFQMVHAYEGSDPGIVGSMSILSEIAREHALGESDEELTVAAVCYLWCKEYDRFLRTMRRIRTLHVHRWYSNAEPADAVAFALEMSKRSTKTETRAA